jgi:ribonuclease E
VAAETAADMTADVATDIPGLGEQPSAPFGDDERDERRGRRRRRGRRGGRRGREREGASPDADLVPSDEDAPEAMPETADAGARDATEKRESFAEQQPQAEPVAPRPEPQPERVFDMVHASGDAEAPEEVRRLSSDPEPPPAPVEPAPQTEPAAAAIEPPAPGPAHAEAVVQADPAESDPLKPARKGWWQRRVTVE